MALVAMVSVLLPWHAALAQDTGYIQVQCEPGLRIFLDGVLKGVSSRDQEGLVIEDVPVGIRELRAVKPSFTPYTQRVAIAKGEIAVVRIAAMRSSPVVEQWGDEEDASIQLRIGSILLRSLPVECTITLERSSGRGWDLAGQIDKAKPEARVSNLEIGNYRVTAIRPNSTLTTHFYLADSDEMTVFFNFVGETVETSSTAAVRAAEAGRENEVPLDRNRMSPLELVGGRIDANDPEVIAAVEQARRAAAAVVQAHYERFSVLDLALSIPRGIAASGSSVANLALMPLGLETIDRFGMSGSETAMGQRSEDIVRIVAGVILGIWIVWKIGQQVRNGVTWSPGSSSSTVEPRRPGAS